MNDLISRQAAIRFLKKMKDPSAKGDIARFHNTIIDNTIDKLKNLPSAPPKIVRCKDCKHYRASHIKDGFVCFLDAGMCEAEPDDFCSRGVRR